MTTPIAHPEPTLSSGRLDRLHRILADHVDRGAAPGLVSVVSRHGETHVDVVGSMDVDGRRPMRRDAVFRISSMTKPITAVAALILVVNVAGIVVSLLTGDPRAMIAKDSLVSSVIAFAILGSVLARRPLMSAGLKPFMTKGAADRAAAWDRLSAGCTRFRRFELLFSTIWGLALLGDCIARLIGAYTLPVTTMVWLSTVLTLGAVGVGIMAGGVAARPIEKMVEAEAAAG